MYKLLATLVVLACLSKQVHSQTISSNPALNEYANKTQEIKEYFNTNDVRPTNYKLSLTVYLGDEIPDKDLMFEGSVVIKIKVEKPVQNITLNAENLHFTRENCILKADNGSIITDYALHFVNRETFQISMLDEKTLSNDFYYLTINYTGEVTKILSEQKGLTKFNYLINGIHDAFLATILHPHARFLFPCFDDYYFKTTFDITVTHYEKYVALSNMHKTGESKSTTNPSMKTTIFKTTPPIPATLLTIFVGDFVTTNNFDDNFNVYALRPSNLKSTLFAYSIGKKILKKYKDLADINLSSNKMDLIFIPTAYYKYPLFDVVVLGNEDMFDENEDTITHKHRAALNVAYNLALDWFGHRIALNSFESIWNLENIAKFLSYYVMDKIEPSWKLWDIFTAEIQNVDFDNFLNQNHPFRGIANLRFMELMLTPPLFFEGLRNYFHTTYHKTVDLDDFFSIMQKLADAQNMKFNSKLTLKQLFNSWMNITKGYPILSVKNNCDDDNNCPMQLTQVPHSKNNFDKWNIPIHYVNEMNLEFNNTYPMGWLENWEPIKNVVQPERSYNHWILLNNPLTGYLRVNYDKKNWRLIISYLKTTHFHKIPVLNRAQLISDALDLVKKQLLDEETLLQLINYLEKETDYIAWMSGIKALNWFGSKLSNTPYYTTYTSYVSNVTACAMKSVGPYQKEESNDIQKIFKASLYNFLCSLGDTSCLNIMHDLLKKWIDDPQNNPFSTDIEEIGAVCYGLENADIDTINKVVEMKLMPLDKALVCSGNKDALKVYFNETYEKLHNFVKTDILIKLGNKGADVDMLLELGDIMSSLNSESAAVAAQAMKTVGFMITKTSQLETMKKSKYAKYIAPRIFNRMKTQLNVSMNKNRDYESKLDETIKDLTKALNPCVL